MGKPYSQDLRERVIAAVDNWDWRSTSYSQPICGGHLRVAPFTLTPKIAGFSFIEERKFHLCPNSKSGARASPRNGIRHAEQAGLVYLGIVVTFSMDRGPLRFFPTSAICPPIRCAPD